jgi:hypothetical protein
MNNKTIKKNKVYEVEQKKKKRERRHELWKAWRTQGKKYFKY